MKLQETIDSVFHSVKSAVTVAAATVTSGLGLFFDWLPSDYLGKIATMVGIVLSVVLIITHWRRGSIEYRKTELEIQIMEQKERERLRARGDQRVTPSDTGRANDGPEVSAEAG